MLAHKRIMFPNFVEEFFGKDLLPAFLDKQARFDTPAVNIAENKDGFTIEVAAPGLEKSDFKIDLHNKVLTISSEKECSPESENGSKYVRREFCYSSFSRSFTLPATADVENISASHKNGILSVEIPKREEAKEKGPRSIDIS